MSVGRHGRPRARRRVARAQRSGPGPFRSPYCHEVRRLFKELKVDATIVDFDAAADGKELRAALNETFGVHTVPQVFVGNKRIGGCDDTLAAYQSGKLKTSLAEVGIKI